MMENNKVLKITVKENTLILEYLFSYLRNLGGGEGMSEGGEGGLSKSGV